MNITSAGIGSGLDLESIIEAYVNAEAVPTEIRLQKKEERIVTELSGVGQFKSALSSFESVLKKLSSPEDFNKQTIDVSSEDIAVTTNGYASNGSFKVEVTQLAKGTRSESTLFGASTDTVGSGNLTFSVGSGADLQTFDVAIDGTDSLSAIRDKINEQAGNFGITANVITTDAGTFLSYSSSVTGDTNELSITNDNASLDAISTNAVIKENAQSAKILVNDAEVTRDTNEFKNIIEDVTITANVENIGNPTTITIKQDEENGTKLINDFVNGYNALRSTLDALGDSESGQLAFDANVRQVKSQLNNIVTDMVSGLSGSLTSLSDIGITIDKYGMLEISPVGAGSLKSGTEKLSDALENNLEEVGEIFASTDGVTSKLTTLIESYNGSDGTLSKRSTALNSDLKGLDDEYAALQEKLRDYEDTLRSRFTFLDQTVSRYNATGAWLTSTLASMQPAEKK